MGNRYEKIFLVFHPGHIRDFLRLAEIQRAGLPDGGSSRVRFGQNLYRNRMHSGHRVSGRHGLPRNMLHFSRFRKRKINPPKTAEGAKSLKASLSAADRTKRPGTSRGRFFSKPGFQSGGSNLSGSSGKITVFMIRFDPPVEAELAQILQRIFRPDESALCPVQPVKRPRQQETQGTAARQDGQFFLFRF